MSVLTNHVTVLGEVVDLDRFKGIPVDALGSDEIKSLHRASRASRTRPEYVRQREARRIRKKCIAYILGKRGVAA